MNGQMHSCTGGAGEPGTWNMVAWQSSSTPPKPLVDLQGNASNAALSFPSSTGNIEGWANTSGITGDDEALLEDGLLLLDSASELSIACQQSSLGMRQRLVSKCARVKVCPCVCRRVQLLLCSIG